MLSLIIRLDGWMYAIFLSFRETFSTRNSIIKRKNQIKTELRRNSWDWKVPKIDVSGPEH